MFCIQILTFYQLRNNLNLFCAPLPLKLQNVSQNFGYTPVYGTLSMKIDEIVDSSRILDEIVDSS